jgi:hypothetical protein
LLRFGAVFDVKNGAGKVCYTHNGHKADVLKWHNFYTVVATSVLSTNIPATAVDRRFIEKLKLLPGRCNHTLASFNHYLPFLPNIRTLFLPFLSLSYLTFPYLTLPGGEPDLRRRLDYLTTKKGQLIRVKLAGRHRLTAAQELYCRQHGGTSTNAFGNSGR